MALWCFEGFSCRITSWLHYCLELWRDWNIYITLTYPTPVWWLLMNTFLTVWKASGSSTWHGISWKPFHLESFKISAVWTNLPCRATNWEHFQKVLFGIWVVWQNSAWATMAWRRLKRGLFRASGNSVKLISATTAWAVFQMEFSMMLAMMPMTTMLSHSDCKGTCWAHWTELSMALWCLKGFSCTITSWLHYCLELWRDWNIYITLSYPTIVWWLSMNIVLTVWKASGPSTWHGISWKPFHLESFKLSAVWTNLTCRATNWEHFQEVFFGISAAWANSICTAIPWEHFQKVLFGIWVVWQNSTWATMAWRRLKRGLFRASGNSVKLISATTAWAVFQMEFSKMLAMMPVTIVQ